jgi:DNA-binding Lrp family transcriptional regulator
MRRARGSAVGEGNALVKRDLPGVRIATPGRLKAMRTTPGAHEGVLLDDLDRQLMTLLMRDGRLGNRALAGMVGAGEVTVGSRLRRLVQANVLIFTAILDWEVAGYEWLVIVRVRVRGRSPREVAELVADVPGCIAASVVFGSADVLAYFLARDRAELRDLVMAELAAAKGVAGVAVDLALTSTVTSLGRTTFLAQGVGDLRLPAPGIPVDAIDVGIIEALLQDGRQSSRRIARTLSVSEGTVRARLGRLLDAGLLKIVAMVNPLAVGLAGVIAGVSLQVRRDAVEEVCAKLAAMQEVAVVATTVGSADVSAVVAVPDRARLATVLQGGIRAIDGVLDADALEMTDIVRFNPFLKRIGT